MDPLAQGSAAPRRGADGSSRAVREQRWTSARTPHLTDHRPTSLPGRAPLSDALAITRRIRFVVPAGDTAAGQARTAPRPALKLILGSGGQAEGLIRRIETCLAELVALAHTAHTDDIILCSVWTDRDHVFLCVEHDRPFPEKPVDAALGLVVVRAVADDHGTHSTDKGYQTWAALRRP